MTGPRPSLAWKIATANILLALFAVLLAGMLQYRKERRILAATMRQELAQVVTSGAMLIDGSGDAPRGVADQGMRPGTSRAQSGTRGATVMVRISGLARSACDVEARLPRSRATRAAAS